MKASSPTASKSWVSPVTPPRTLTRAAMAVAQFNAALHAFLVEHGLLIALDFSVNIIGMGERPADAV